MKIIRPVLITDSILTSSISEDDHPVYNAGTTYAIDDFVISTTTHRIYQSLQASNTGNPLPVSPEISTSWWVDVGATNRFKMFDRGVSVQSEDSDLIRVSITPGRVDSVAMLNMDAQTYRVRLFDNPGSPSNTVYDTGEVSLGLDSQVVDWYQYFFEPTAVRKTDIVITDIPPYTTGVLEVTLMSPSATVRIGELVVGQYRELGDMQWAPRVGIIDYSKKDVDEFGNVNVVERAFSKRLTAEVFMPNAGVDEAIRIMSLYRAIPVVWAGSDEFTSTIVFGFYRSFDVVIQSPGGSFCNLEIEGLT